METDKPRDIEEIIDGEVEIFQGLANARAKEYYKASGIIDGLRIAKGLIKTEEITKSGGGVCSASERCTRFSLDWSPCYTPEAHQGPPESLGCYHTKETTND